jgi:F420-dependent oxidoreductase-like protein
MQRPLRVDIKTSPQFVSYEDVLHVWQEADRVPIITGAWLFDHFMPLGTDQTGPIFEGWTLLAALAARTERLRLGLMVTGNTYRHPAVLANIAATVDVISNGRLDFGIGAGWNEYEHEAYGIPLYRPGPRIRRFGEACEVIRRLWTETAPDFEGRYYRLEHAYCEPKPIQKPYPPFVIGGSGEQLTLGIVARYADVWNAGGGDIENFRHKNRVLEEHCAAIGRDPSEILRSVQLRLDPQNPEALLESARGLVEAGAGHIVVMLSPPYPQNVVELVAERIARPLLDA